MFVNRDSASDFTQNYVMLSFANKVYAANLTTTALKWPVSPRLLQSLMYSSYTSYFLEAYQTLPVYNKRFGEQNSFYPVRMRSKGSSDCSWTVVPTEILLSGVHLNTLMASSTA